MNDAREDAAWGDSTLDRIRSLLDTPRRREGAYSPRPCLAEPELLAWEAAHGVTLPEEYRQFLREVGNGGLMPGSYCDFKMTPLAEVRGGPGAATPFPSDSRSLASAAPAINDRGPASRRPAVSRTGSVLGGSRPTTRVRGVRAVPERGRTVPGDGRRSARLGLVRGLYGVPEMGRSGEPLGFLAWFADALSEFVGAR